MARINALKVPLKEVQQVKKKLVNKKLFEYSFGLVKDDDFCYIPIKVTTNKEFAGYEIVQVEAEKIKEETSLKNLLKNELTAEEFENLKTAYDIIGDIAIIEVPEILNEKANLVGEKLLLTNKNVKTVLMKHGIHEGVFRTQKLKHVAGTKTKETIHKENNIELKLNVETVYFSPRLSTERKRIMKQVRKDEDVLVMFSGCAPYPCVLSKNTAARYIVGIESNPEGHKYGMENVRRNKLHNVVLIKGDVKEVVPQIYGHVVGMKSSDNQKQLNKRLVYHPVIMELHLHEHDLFEGKEKLEKTITHLQGKGVHVMLHMPFGYDGKRFSLGQENVERELKMFKSLGDLCKKYHVKAVVHPTQDIGIAEDEDMLVGNIKKLKRYYDYFYFENVTHGLFAKTEDIIRIGRKAGMKKMCIDTCHLYIMYQDNDLIEKHIKLVRQEFDTYYHLNDHDYKTHSCEIGQGYVDFSKILPYVNFGVTEICSQDEYHPVEMINSFLRVEHEPRKFDRILMPLPKSAGDFLDTAFMAAKKGTVIHFYDFLHEDDFAKAEEKVSDACKRNGWDYRKLDFVKCGQYAPKTFRVCLDFEVF